MQFQAFQQLDAELCKTYQGKHADGRCVAMALGFRAGDAMPNRYQARLIHFSIPELQKPESVLEMYARSDRLGSSADNLQLSTRRLSAIQYLLEISGAAKDKVYTPRCLPLGERFEALLGVRNVHASRGGRTVWVFVWPSDAAYNEGPSEDSGGMKRLTDFGRRLANSR